MEVGKVDISKIGALAVVGVGSVGLISIVQGFIAARIQGLAYNDLSEGVEGVTVELDGSSVVTGADGLYGFQLSPGDYIITFTKDNYYTVSRTVSLLRSSDLAFNVPMKETIIDSAGTTLCAPMVEGSGAIVLDVSLYAHDGLLGDNVEARMPSWDILPSGKRCLGFSSGREFVNFGDLGIPAGGPASIAGWFTFADLAKNRGTRMYLYGGLLYQHYANNYLYFEATNDFIPFVPVVGTPYYLVLTYSGETSTARLYANKVQYNAFTQPGSHIIPAFPGYLSWADMGFVGKATGALRGFSRVLSKAEADSLYDSEVSLIG